MTSFIPPSTLKGPDRVIPVPAVLAGLPSLHRDAAGEASASVSARASQPRSGSKALSGPGAVGAVLGPVHREKLLCQQHHQGEVVETPSTCPWMQRQQGNAASTAGFQQFDSNLNSLVYTASALMMTFIAGNSYLTTAFYIRAS